LPHMPAVVLPPFLARMHQENRRVHALVDCLHWTRPQSAPERDVLARFPELAERTAEGEFGPEKAGKYASPFNPRVRAALCDLLREIGSRYPELDGVVFRCRLPADSVLGYSEAARVAYIRASQLDPLDVVPDGAAAAKVYAEWSQWRAEQMAALVKELSAAFRTVSPKARVGAAGQAGWFQMAAAPQNNFLEDWPAWAAAGSVDEIILEHSWREAGAAEVYSS